MDAVVVESVVRYAHFLGIILLASMLILENVLLKTELSSSDLRKIAAFDGLYGLGAVLTLGAGLMLWLSVGKPAEFYNANPVFHTKLTLFLIVALVSIIPTLFFLKNRRVEASSVAVPKHILVIKRLELVGILIIPLLAALMALGIGISV